MSGMSARVRFACCHVDHRPDSRAASRRFAAITFPPVTAQKWTLPNGLTIIVQTDRSAPVASVQAWCGTGSIDEGRHLGAGLSHILEHMLFKGTKTRTTNAIAQSIQDEGGYINAYTSFDRTVYWIDVPKEGVTSALDILADAMMNSTLPAEEYAKEQEVIRREFAMGYDDPDRMIGQLMFETAYQRHPYRLPVIGEIQIFDQLTQQDVMRYYKSRYVPNNLTFVVVGDVDAEQIHAQLRQYFAAYPPRARSSRAYIPEEPPQLGRREVHEEFATELTRLALAWHIPEITHPDVPALDLLSTILGDGRSSRLYRRGARRSGPRFRYFRLFLHSGRSRRARDRCDARTGQARGSGAADPANRRRIASERCDRRGTGEGEKDFAGSFL